MIGSQLAYIDITLHGYRPQASRKTLPVPHSNKFVSQDDDISGCLNADLHPATV